MEQKKILFGFDAPKFENEVIKLLKKKGYEVESTVKFTKSSIRDFLLANPSYETAVLLEVMNNSADSSVAKYNAEELAMLTDERDVNIIVILNDNRKGTKFMETLYTAGITSALYQKGRHGGATAKDIAELIIEKRNKRQAREYYGIADAPINLGFLGNDTFTEYYNRLQDETYGSTLIERFCNICTMMNKKQIADFIRRTPQEVVDELKKYEEFHVILEFIKGNGIDLKIKRPKKIQIGLSTPGNMERVRLQIGQNEGISQVKTDDGQISFSGNDVNRVVREPIIEKPDEPRRRTGNTYKKTSQQSFADLLDNMWDDDETDEEEPLGADDSFFYYEVENPSGSVFPNNELLREQAGDGNIQVHDEEAGEDISVEEFLSEKKRTNKKRKKKRTGNVGNYVAIGVGVVSALLIVIGVLIIIF